MPRHLPVIVTVSNSEILAVTRKVPENEFEVYRHVAATEMWNDYQRTLRGLRSRGVATVSVPAQELSTASINEYLRIKDTRPPLMCFASRRDASILAGGKTAQRSPHRLPIQKTPDPGGVAAVRTLSQFR